MYIALWALGLVLAFVMTAFIYKKIEAGRMVIVGCALQISIYILSSGILIFADQFSVLRAECLSLIITGAITFILAIVLQHRIEKIYPAIKKYLPLVVVLVVAGFLTSYHKAGLYSTSQDEGLYQMKAMMYMNGYNDNELEFEEYGRLENGAEKAVYIGKLSEMEGVYLTYRTYESGDARTTYEIHGIGTFASLLAVFGNMFGISNMNIILSVCYLLSIAEAWIICDNLKLKRYVSLSIAVLMTVCPIVLWCSMNVLTEIVMTMLIGLFLVFISENIKKKVFNWSVVPVIAFCYFHVTATVLLPLFMLIYLYMYIWVRKKTAIVSIIFTLVAYVTGLKMMYTSASIYTSKNMIPLFAKVKNILNDNNFVLIMTLLSGVFIGLLLLLEYKGVFKKIRQVVRKLRKNPKTPIVFRAVMAVVVVFIIALFILLGFKTVSQGNSIERMTILSFLFMTGYLILPVAMLGMILNAPRIIKDHGRMAIVMSLVYVLLIYCAFIWRDIYYYYYYARYFAPFMVLAFVCAAMVFDYFKPQYVLPVVLVVAGLLVYNNLILYTSQDLTYGGINVVSSIASCVDEKDAVVFMDDAFSINKMLMLPVKATTGADIYFLNSDYGQQITNLKESYEYVFVLGYDVNFPSHATFGRWNEVYQGVFHTSTYDGLETKGFPIPTTTTMFDSPLALYIYQGY